jgi:hypothetical protein
MDDLRSEKSIGSRASRNLKGDLKPAVPKGKKQADLVSEITASVRGTVKSTDSDIEEEDEFFAIQKFNALLHFEEQK